MKRFCWVILFLPAVSKADTYVVSFDGMHTQEAKKVANVMRRRACAPVHVHYVPFAKATHQNFVNNMNWLKKNVTKDDLVIIYLAGHGGVTRRGRFNLGAKRGTIWAREICKTTESLPGTCLVLFDSCECGGALSEPWRRTTVVCSSASGEISWTDVMCPAICEIMRKGGTLRVRGFVFYLLHRIPRIAATQHPKVYFGKSPNCSLSAIYHTEKR